MSLSEILSKLTPKTQNYEGAGVRGVSELTWQDILQAMQGVDPGKTGFMLCVYANDTQAHHFWAGLFIEVMARPDVQAWREARSEEGRRGPIKALCYLAVKEWTSQGDKWTHQRRADEIGVSRGTWNRKYSGMYQLIFEIPTYWQDEVEILLRQRLR